MYIIIHENVLMKITMIAFKAACVCMYACMHTLCYKTYTLENNYVTLRQKELRKAHSVSVYAVEFQFYNYTKYSLWMDE